MAQEKDIVLIYFEEQPIVFARIEDILPDSKKDWYHIKLLMLQVPLQTVTWILRDVYIDGAEFTMNGKKMRLELVESPDETDINNEQEPGNQKPEDQRSGSLESDKSKEDSGNAKVISLSDRKK